MKAKFHPNASVNEVWGGWPTSRIIDSVDRAERLGLAHQSAHADIHAGAWL
jgi:hypothetical protein